MDRRRGMTLLELVMASSLTTVLVIAAATVLRGAHLAWDAQEDDFQRIQAAQATLRHVVRGVRQAQAVTAISDSANAAGTLSLLTAGGTTLVWARDGATSQVNYGVGAANQLLAENITQLKFTGFKADGVTTTLTPADIQAVRCEVTITLPRQVGATRTFACRAWLRVF